MLHTLLYVSYSTLYMPEDEKVVESIVHRARQRNAGLGLTGALIFTYQRFAQFLEGPEAGIAELMASIRRDPRHRDIVVVMAGRSSRRRFPAWEMAYSGTSDLVAARVDALVMCEINNPVAVSADRLIQLMALSSSAPGIQRAA